MTKNCDSCFFDPFYSLDFIFQVQSYGDNRDFLSIVAPENVIT